MSVEYLLETTADCGTPRGDVEFQSVFQLPGLSVVATILGLWVPRDADRTFPLGNVSSTTRIFLNVYSALACVLVVLGPMGSVLIGIKTEKITIISGTLITLLAAMCFFLTLYKIRQDRLCILWMGKDECQSVQVVRTTRWYLWAIGIGAIIEIALLVSGIIVATVTDSSHYQFYWPDAPSAVTIPATLFVAFGASYGGLAVMFLVTCVSLAASSAANSLYNLRMRMIAVPQTPLALMQELHRCRVTIDTLSSRIVIFTGPLVFSLSLCAVHESVSLFLDTTHTLHAMRIVLIVFTLVCLLYMLVQMACVADQFNKCCTTARDLIVRHGKEQDGTATLMAFLAAPPAALGIWGLEIRFGIVVQVLYMGVTVAIFILRSL